MDCVIATSAIRKWNTSRGDRGKQNFAVSLQMMLELTLEGKTEKPLLTKHIIRMGAPCLFQLIWFLSFWRKETTVPTFRLVRGKLRSEDRKLLSQISSECGGDVGMQKLYLFCRHQYQWSNHTARLEYHQEHQLNGSLNQQLQFTVLK